MGADNFLYKLLVKYPIFSYFFMCFPIFTRDALRGQPVLKMGRVSFYSSSSSSCFYYSL